MTNDLIQKYREALIFQNLSDSTITQYCNYVNNFVSFCAKDEITTAHFHSYINLKNNAKNALISFHKFVRETGLIKDHLIVSAKSQKNVRSAEEKDYDYILKNLSKCEPEGKILIILLLSNLRINEALNTKACHISSWGQIEVQKKTAKAEHGRNAAVNTELLKFLQEYIKNNNKSPNEYLLSQGKKLRNNQAKIIFNQAMEAMGIGNKYTPHHLRHLAVTNSSYEHSLKAVMDNAGHNYAGQTVDYIHMSLESLRDKLDLHPYYSFNKKEG